MEAATKAWELNLYELHREPQPAITDDTCVQIGARTLKNELMCPICLDMLTNTMTTKECLHRFCSQCIVTALRNSNKECPTCRKKLVSKRSLRPDPNFDQLIAKIFPNRDEYEELQKKSQAFIESSKNTIMTNAQLALKQQVSNEQNASDQVELILDAHEEDLKDISSEEDRENLKKFIKVKSIATISHFKEYIRIRNSLGFATQNLYEMFFKNVEEYIKLPDDMTLNQVIEKYWKANKPLELFYKKVGTENSNQ